MFFLKKPRTDVVAMGLAGGIVWAAVLLIYSVLAGLTGYGIEVETFLESLLPGYTLTVAGTIVGVIWVFCLGYLTNIFYAWVYNALSKKTE